jgi:hypothetical protein
VEVKSLDPSKNSSVLRLGEHELNGPYLPGRFRGDRVTLFIRPELLLALPRDGRPAANQVPAALEAVSERPESVRLQFSGGVSVSVPRIEYERQKHNKEWVVEFPSAWLKVL